MSFRTASAELSLKVFTNMPPYGIFLGMLNVFGHSQCLHNYLCGTVVVCEGPVGIDGVMFFRERHNEAVIGTIQA